MNETWKRERERERNFEKKHMVELLSQTHLCVPY